MYTRISRLGGKIYAIKIAFGGKNIHNIKVGYVHKTYIYIYIGELTFPFSTQRNLPRELTATLSISGLERVWRHGGEGKSY